MTDDELIEGFEGARLGTFHHTDHVRVAWIYLRRLGLYRALAAVSEGLMRLAAARKTFNADWEREARNWIAWARTPGHNSYWQYSPAFFEIVPAPGRATLEVGCGEGRVARDLARRGHRVSGIDASPTLIDAAREADPGGDYSVPVPPRREGAIDPRELGYAPAPRRCIMLGP